MNGSNVLLRELEALGVEVVFGYPGGAIMPVYDALRESPLRHVLARHEQGAALAASGYARASGRPGVCLATSGPGATNLLTGIADAFLDSIPIVAITGQVPTGLMGTDAFQEVDIFGMSMPVVKHSYIVRDVTSLPSVVREAFRVATTGRPGPVLIDLPKDVANAGVEHEPLPADPIDRREAPPPRQLALAAELLRTAQRPVIYAGGGIALGSATDAFRAFVEHLGVPVVTTLKGIGTLPTGHELLLGMLGMHGSKAANLAVQESDLLLGLGVRFDDRATGKLDRFAPDATVIHLDVDAAEIGKLRRADVPLRGDLHATLGVWRPTPPRCEPWRALCLERKTEPRYDAPGDGVYAPAFLRDLTSGGDWTVACDVGQHQMWVAQHARFDRPEQHLSSGGLGTMGFGIPAAIGAQLADPSARVVAVTGDGSVMMNVQELATIRRYGLPIRIVVLDNQSLGLVRQWQECFFERRYSEIDLSDNPDFCAVAESFGIPAFTVERAADVAAAIERLRHADGPVLAHVVIDSKANVWPLVPPNNANSEMIDEVPQCTS